MPKYYNKTSSRLCASLKDGSSVGLPPRTWVTVDESLETTPSLQGLVKLGKVVRSKDRVARPAPAPDAAPEPTIAEVKQAPVKVEVAPVVETPEPVAEDAPEVTEEVVDKNLESVSDEEDSSDESEEENPTVIKSSKRRSRHNK